ncbi:MAG TPA: DUF4097 family beta strand repeat-containing protein [Gemmatimonadaceae bacterium]|jgi:DUF4097 and DUF4098 domain-containing protein YvlB|nr:DUF4097 family beta strand repeat-containing protein [Gemmatimonadaceae bacterium]
MRRSRLYLSLVLAAALTAGAAHRAAAQRRGSRDSEYRSRIDTTLAFDRNGTVTVTAGNGDIIVTGAQASAVHVRATSDDDNLRIDASAARMSVEVSNRHGGDSRIEVSVPYGVRVILHSLSGDISTHGTRGEIEARAQSGDVLVEDATRLDINTLSGGITASTIRGDVAIQSTSGDVKITDLRGDADVQTVSGDIELRGVTAKVIRAKTTSGDVTYDGTIDKAGRYDLSANSGDVRLHIPRDTGAQLTVSTWNGEFQSDFPITLRPGEHGIGSSNSKHLTFEINGGGARISAETFSGDVTVSSNGRGARP